MCVDSSTYHFFAGTNHQEKEVSMAYSGCDINIITIRVNMLTIQVMQTMKQRVNYKKLDIKNFIFIMSQLIPIFHIENNNYEK